jgi:SRSO17 transposase
MHREIFTNIKNFFGNFKGLLSKPQQENFIIYVLGLMLPCNKTVNGIAEELKIEKNQSSLNRFLTESQWNIKEVYSTLFEFIKPKLTGTVYLIVDDTLCEKTGEKIKGVARHFDHNQKRTVLSHSIVCGIIKCADVVLPYGIELYRKKETCNGIKFKTKISIAKGIIERFLSLEFQSKIILFDAFYPATEIIKAIGKSAYWVSNCKKNRLVKVGGFYYSLKQLASYIKPEQYTEVKIKEKTYFIFEYEAEVKDIGLIKIVFSKKKRHSGSISYFISNMLDAGGREVLLHYSERWSIEVFFRTAKQTLGLGRYQMRSLKGIIKHWCLVAVTYGLLSCLLSSLKKRCATIGKMCKLIREDIIKTRLRFSVS